MSPILSTAPHSACLSFLLVMVQGCLGEQDWQVGFTAWLRTPQLLGGGLCTSTQHPDPSGYSCRAGFAPGGLTPHPAGIGLQDWEQRGVKRNKAGVKLSSGELQAESAFVAASGRLEEDPALSGSRLLLKPSDPLRPPRGAPCSAAPAATRAELPDGCKDPPPAAGGKQP